MITEKIVFEILSLPAKSRAILAEQLIASLDEEAQADVEKLWLKRAEQRFKAIKEGSVNCKTMPDLLRDTPSKRARLLEK